MALEALIEGGKPKKFNRDSFYNAQNTLKELSDIDPTTAEGIGKYVELTGHKEIGDLTPGEASYLVKAVQQGRGEEVAAYTESCFDGLCAEIEDTEQIGYAIQFAPEKSYKKKDLKEGETDGFDNLSKEINAYRKTMESIQTAEGQQKFIGDQVKKLSGNLIGSYIARAIQQDPEGYLSMKAAAMQQEIYTKVSKFGGGHKFIGEARKRVKSDYEKAQKELESIAEERAKEAQKIQEQAAEYQRSGVTLSAEQQAKIQSDFKNKYSDLQKKVVEKYRDPIILMQEAPQAITQKAYEAIGTKIEQEKASEDKFATVA